MILNIFLVIFLVILKKINGTKEILLILGCENEIIQNERINEMKNYLKNYDKLDFLKKNIIIFVSGGIKNSISSIQSESIRILDNLNNLDNKIKIIIDESATNTVENILNLRKWINKNYLKEEFRYTIITSDFHKNRVLKIFKYIFKNNEINLILSKSECKRCWIDELYHFQNIENDIKKAI